MAKIFSNKNNLQVLYEDNHIQLLASFLEAHSKPDCEIIIVDPGRGRKNKLSSLMVDFGFTSSHQKPIHTDYLDHEFKGHILKFQR